MLDTREERYEALVATREFLSDRSNWIKGSPYSRGTSTRGERYCITTYISVHFLGWQDTDIPIHERGWRAAPEFLKYLNSTVRDPFRTVTRFNDSRYVSHEEMLAWLDDRIAELAPVEEEQKELVEV